MALFKTVPILLLCIFALLSFSYSSTMSANSKFLCAVPGVLTEETTESVCQFKSLSFCEVFIQQKNDLSQINTVNISRFDSILCSVSVSIDSVPSFGHTSNLCVFAIPLAHVYTRI